MAVIRYAPRALTDLERLCDFLVQRDPDTAARTVELIAAAVAVLEQHPLMGHRVESNLRELVISRGRSGYLALYAYDELRDRVLVHCIRHQREAGYTE